MRCGIITTPKRAGELSRLAESLRDSVSEIVVFNDKRYRGHWWNLERCLTEMIDTANGDEPVLTLCDDVIPAVGWLDRWQNIHKEAQGGIYTMFSRQRGMFTPENMGRGWVKSCRHGGFYDQAVIWIGKQGFMGQVNRWFAENKSLVHKNRQGWLDMVISDYMTKNKVEWTLTVPTLFDHIGEATGHFGHKVGRSPYFL